ncbi:hypothetical protein XELAEV_18005945mg [Xenopus laevis]|uniref:Uncharacterized protein n=1 Tax=Xenopus laevis TaxID=8355 RepID=A0A974I3P7_XENLA|nr:hypothetical protein XELAEV_18005945mg [Xenopus laevis]
MGPMPSDTSRTAPHTHIYILQIFGVKGGGVTLSKSSSGSSWHRRYNKDLGSPQRVCLVLRMYVPPTFNRIHLLPVRPEDSWSPGLGGERKLEQASPGLGGLVLGIFRVAEAPHGSSVSQCNSSMFGSHWAALGQRRSNNTKEREDSGGGWRHSYLNCCQHEVHLTTHIT